MMQRILPSYDLKKPTRLNHFVPVCRTTILSLPVVFTETENDRDSASHVIPSHDVMPSYIMVLLNIH